MSEHIEWARARDARPQFALPSWVEANADDGNDNNDSSIVLDTGSSTVAIYGQREDLAEFAQKLVRRVGIAPRVSNTQYEAVCAVVDRVKMDDLLLDTDQYASEIVAALGLSL